MWIYIIIGIVIIVAVVLCFSGMSKSSYTAEEIHPIAEKLVHEVAPKVRRRRFNKADIDEMLGDMKLDQVIYYQFRRLLHKRALTVDNLIGSLVK